MSLLNTANQPNKFYYTAFNRILYPLLDQFEGKVNYLIYIKDSKANSFERGRLNHGLITPENLA